MGASIAEEDMPASWGLEEGDLIAPGLHVLRKLGGGSRYEAYLAFDDRLHYVVVAKVIRPVSVGDSSALRGLRREAEILGSLQHPVIPRILGARFDGDRPHLVLEMIEGPRLSTILRKFGSLDTEQVAPLAVELAAALHYLHGRELVHLDVKPTNVILGAPPRLIDLSIARSVDEAAGLDVAVGTDAYMAPEQCRPGPGAVGPPADVWGLGATLHEAVTGRCPFARGIDDPRAPLEERFPQLTMPAADLPSGVPSQIAGVIEAALARDPTDRPSARNVAEAVEPLLSTPRRFVLRALRPG